MRRLIAGLVIFMLSAGACYAAGIDENTNLYYKFAEGPDEATTCEDFSGNEHSPTFVGTAKLDDAVTKYAGDTTSLLLDGSGYVTIPDSADWDVMGSTSQDYTIDFWMRANDTGTDLLVAQIENKDTDFWTVIKTAGGIQFLAYSGGGAVITTGYAGSYNTDGTWNHVAMVKKGGASAAEWAIYIDGTQVSYLSDNSTDTYSGTLRVGGDPGDGLYFNGSMAHLRIQASNIFSATPVVGLTDTITVPTEPYSADTGEATPQRGGRMII